MARLSTKNYKQEVNEFLRLASMGYQPIFFDLETTGLDSNIDKILSCSAIKCQLKGNVFEEIDRMDLFMDPTFPIPEESTEVHGITNEMVKGKPTDYEGYFDIKEFFGFNPLLCGFNSTKFDEKFLDDLYRKSEGEFFEPIFHLDVYTMSREKLELKKYTLENIATSLDMDIGVTFHESIDDVIATKRVFEHLLPIYMRDDDAGSGQRVQITGLNYWATNHRNARIYVETYPFYKTYYDIYKKEWVCESDNVNLHLLRKDVLARVNKKDEKEMVKLLKGDFDANKKNKQSAN